MHAGVILFLSSSSSSSSFLSTLVYTPLLFIRIISLCRCHNANYYPRCYYGCCPCHQRQHQHQRLIKDSSPSSTTVPSLSIPSFSSSVLQKRPHSTGLYPIRFFLSSTCLLVVVFVVVVVVIVLFLIELIKINKLCDYSHH